MSPADLCEIRPKLPQKSPTGLSTQGPGPPSFPASWTLSARFRRGLWGGGGHLGSTAPLWFPDTWPLGSPTSPTRAHSLFPSHPQLLSFLRSEAPERRVGCQSSQNGGVCTPCLLGRAAFRVPAGPAAAPRRHRSQVTLRPTQLSRVWRGGRGGQRQRFSRTLGAGTPGMRPARSPPTLGAPGDPRPPSSSPFLCGRAARSGDI